MRIHNVNLHIVSCKNCLTITFLFPEVQTYTASNNMSYFLLGVIAICMCFECSFTQPYNTPLDPYIAAEDNYYSYNETGMYSGINVAGSWKAYIVNMTSQKWLNETFVNQPIWYHWLLVVIPEKIKYNDFATVIGTGNHNSHSAPPNTEEYFLSATYIATHTQTITAVLYNITNEPLLFYNDPLQKSRTEDALVAFGKL